MHSSLTMGSIIGIVNVVHILALISSTLISIHAESNAHNTDNETKEEQTRSALCDALGVSGLGMESGAIPDTAITASSAYNELSTGSKLARETPRKRLTELSLSLWHYI
ncbi:unnamed protein product [Oppiella nova]|uniref:Uncharacterized protein n=1 Tax=Oppiella nova TaxID=334625 RepID=A0A7R9LEM2_9ACAR|nr:unnamed protein product [Oppiella nova]CAG2162367.1 unnamed protein product [Oppiella nova]